MSTRWFSGVILLGLMHLIEFPSPPWGEGARRADEGLSELATMGCLANIPAN